MCCLGRLLLLLLPLLSPLQRQLLLLLLLLLLACLQTELSPQSCAHWAECTHGACGQLSKEPLSITAQDRTHGLQLNGWASTCMTAQYAVSTLSTLECTCKTESQLYQWRVNNSKVESQGQNSSLYSGVPQRKSWHAHAATPSCSRYSLLAVSTAVLQKSALY